MFVIGVAARDTRARLTARSPRRAHIGLRAHGTAPPDRRHRATLSPARDPRAAHLLPAPSDAVAAARPCDLDPPRVSRSHSSPRISFAVWAVSLPPGMSRRPMTPPSRIPLSTSWSTRACSRAGSCSGRRSSTPARRRRLTVGRRAAVALLALLADGALRGAPRRRPAVARYAGVTDRPFGLTQETDQARAGL